MLLRSKLCEKQSQICFACFAYMSTIVVASTMDARMVLRYSVVPNVY